jgi:hypothetical protein
MQRPTPAPLPSIDADLQRVEGSVPAEWSESTVGPKHYGIHPGREEFGFIVPNRRTRRPCGSVVRRSNIPSAR